MLTSCALPGFSQGRDTALAVHKLFVQRRGGGEGWAATGLGTAVDESVGKRSSTDKTHSNVASAAFYGGVPLALGMRQAIRFSEEREAFILKQYAEGWSIPPDIRRKLKRKHFRRTTRDVLNAKP
ncbi:hypothetical protein [Hymenobacter sp.]|uniref:hypothetical protein n=1 Tax=Hymenobacter sp. TaxID=1898978 RepID=UPI00286C44EC|nr:hypothetical protein [Hymenobacter sp.]